MKLYLVRHGQSVNNARGLWTGWHDVPLTDKGREDALGAKRVLEEVSFDRVYSSDLIRARETAQVVLPAYDAEPLALLREVDVGNIAGQPLSVLTEEDKQKTASCGYECFGGESLAAFRGRVKAFLKMVAEGEDETVAAFCHAGFLRAALSEALGVELPRGSVVCGNCAVEILEYRNGKWSLYGWINV